MEINHNKNIKELFEIQNNEFIKVFDSNSGKAFEQYGLTQLYSMPDDMRIKYETALGFEPVTAIDFYNLGVEAINKNDLKKALKDLKNAIKIDSKHMGSFYNIGLIYESMEDKEKANEAFREYIKLYDEQEKKYSMKDSLGIPFSPLEEEFYKEACSRVKKGGNL